MKAKPFKATPVPSLVGKGPSDRITRREVVALVAARVGDQRDNDRTARTRVSTNIYDAMKAGKLREVRPGVFRLGDIGGWARAKWPERDFSDIPISPVIGNVSVPLPGFRMASGGYTHAPTLEVAIKEILDLRAKNRTLAEALAAAEGQVRDLEPDARKLRSWIKNKEGKRKK